MKPYEEWLLKADHDLKSAELLVKNSELLDTSIYHTQQCAEKALKAFLVYHEQEIEKTHHLKIILERCILIDESFTGLTEHAIFLTPFATGFRYPDDWMMPDLADVEQAILSAGEIYSFIKEKINV